MRKPLPSQRARALWLLAYAVALPCANWFVTGSWLPPVAPEGLWFYTAAVTLLLGDLVVSPYYVGPKDTLAVAIPAVIAVWFLVGDSHASTNPWLMWSTLGFCLMAASLAVATMLSPKASGDSPRIPREWLFAFCQTVGHPRVILSAVLATLLVSFHLGNPEEILLVGGTWAALVGVQPERPIYWTWRKIAAGRDGPRDFGTVIGYQSPGLLLIRQESDRPAELGEMLVSNDPRGPARIGRALDYAGRDEGLLLRCLELEVPKGSRSMVNELGRRLGPERVGLIEVGRAGSLGFPDESRARFTEHLAGIVTENTDVDRLYFEVIQERDLEEGHLVEVEIRGRPVLYQVVNGLTKEDIVHRKHKHGFARAEASKIGTWDGTDQRFAAMKWLPKLNAPVCRATGNGGAPDAATVGRFPGSAYSVGIRSVSDLVTHNTAILGILGIGKSMLAIELVERMLAEGIKVVCLDLTDQYAEELSAWHSPEADLASTERIREAGERDHNDFADNPEEGGSFPNLKAALQEELADFMASDHLRLRILNPARFAATRQEKEPRSYSEAGTWKRTAPLWSVTPVQVTQVVAETLLLLAQDEMRTRAHVCLVLEEAHSLVPEWNTVAQDADRNATNGTARAILQGRKYGFGTLLVTQRTANVTKTILNQCNTVFAMRTFDDTGKAFLANYLGSTYADVLSTLGEREAVFFGKASTCENPVRLRLNDRPDFLARFRGRFPPPDLEGNAGEEPEAGQAGGDPPETHSADDAASAN